MLQEHPTLVIDEHLIEQIKGLSMVLAGAIGTIVGAIQMYFAHLKKVQKESSQKVERTVEEVRKEVTGTDDSNLKGTVTQSAEDIKKLNIELGRLRNDFAQRVTEWKFEANELKVQSQQLKEELREERQETLLVRNANAEAQRGMAADVREIQRSLNMLNKFVIEALQKHPHE